MATARKPTQLKRTSRQPSTAKAGRLVARVNSETQALVAQAAEISGASVSQFIVEAAMEKAGQILGDLTRLKLKANESKTLFDLLDKPPVANRKLKAAVQHYRKAGLDDA